MIPLTKTLSPVDYEELTDERLVVDRYFKMEREQAPQRRWEYALALRAGRLFKERSEGRQAADVGGAGSPLARMLVREGFFPLIVDPETTMDLARAVTIHDMRVDFVTCISVVEHVLDVLGFIEDLARLVKPGGVLFLTMDIWDKPDDAVDTAHFADMRERIFTPRTWRMLGEELKGKGFDWLGEQDWGYHGDQLYGSYSFASLALVKHG